MRIVVDGVPVAKGRPRMTRSGHTYTPEKTKEYEAKILGAYLSSQRDFFDSDTPLRVEMTVVLPIAESLSKREKIERENGEKKPTSRPDLDNYIKCLDALNGWAWHDDSQIVCIVAEKRYGKHPRMEIIIEEQV